MVNHDVISMPDKWEYPWYAAWDLAFHCIPLMMVDPDFAKSQLDLMLSQLYLHPSGQIPAYEWNFGDVNPPVHAFATLFLHDLETAHIGAEDVAFTPRVVHASLLLNFTWWVNRKDPSGTQRVRGRLPRPRQHRSVRPQRDAARRAAASSRPTAPRGWRCSARTCSSWRWLLAEHDPSYEDFVLKFVEHFFWIAAAVDPIGDHPDELWDDEDGFFYDVLRLPRRHRPAAQGALARRAPADVRHHRHRAGGASPASRARGPHPRLPRPQPRPARHHRRPARRPASTAATSCRSSTRTSSGAS